MTTPLEIMGDIITESESESGSNGPVPFLYSIILVKYRELAEFPNC